VLSNAALAKIGRGRIAYTGWCRGEAAVAAATVNEIQEEALS